MMTFTFLALLLAILLPESDCLRVSSTSHFGRKSLGMAELDDVFGQEFTIKRAPLPVEALETNKLQISVNNIPDIISPYEKSMQSYQRMRFSLFSDSLIVSIISFSAMWYFFPLKESLSFGVGSAMGIVYSLLLGRFVERLGTSRENRASDGLRFAPVVILVLLYAKFKAIFSLIPEIAGFVVSYQLAAFLQAFNDDPYGEIDDMSGDQVK